MPEAKAKTKVKSLHEKVLEISKAVGSVEKTGKNGEYSYVQASRLMESVYKELHKHGIRIFSNVAKVEHVGTKVLLYLEINITDTDNHQKIHWVGEGQDTSDKALYKAYTGARKYFLLDYFQLPIGLDPETDPSPKTTPKLSNKRVETLWQEFTASGKEHSELRNKIIELGSPGGNTVKEAISALSKAGADQLHDWLTS